jgi:hypothetical protein
MTSDELKQWHKRLLFIWGGPGLAISVALVLLTSQVWVLVWNLILSIYTVLMEHYLGMRAEDQNVD